MLSRRFLLAFTCFVIATIPLSSSGAPGALPDDADWSDQFGLPPVDGDVRAAVIWNGNLIIGGQFYQAGGTAATNIARWDGTRWNAMGAGFDEVVLTLLVQDGKLFAGGRFSHSGGRSLSGVAVWNGTGWGPMAEGLESTFPAQPCTSALAVYHGELIATGEFRHSGPTPLDRIARWDGSRWQPLAAGLGGPGLSLAVLGDSLIVGGSFPTAGGTPASSVAAWDGSRWSPLPGVRLGNQAGAVHVLTTIQNHLFAGGEFDSAGVVPARNIASWNGANWDSLGSGVPARVTCMAGHLDHLYVGLYLGSQGVLQWSGESWRWTAPMEFGFPEALLSSGTDLIVGGSFRANDPAGAIEAFNLARWTGTKWLGYETWTGRMHGLSTMFGSSSDVTAVGVYHDEILIGGSSRFGGSPPQYWPLWIVPGWNGSQWQDVMPPPVQGQVASFLVEGDTLYAAGHFRPEYWVPNNPVYRLAGGTWSVMDTLDLTATCLVRYQGSLYIGTERGSSQAPLRAGLFRWNGLHWEEVARATSTDPFFGIRSMMVHDGKLIVSGLFEEIGGVGAINVASWDGSTWEPLGGGLASDWFGATGLAEWNGGVVAAGAFPLLSGGGSAVAAWDGSTWRGLGSLGGIGRTVRNVRGTLYAGGWFGAVRQHVQGLLRFEDSAWVPLGSGVNGPVEAIEEFGDQLVVGGSFTLAGGKSSFGLAMWSGLAPRSTAPAATLTPARPNPFLGSTRLVLDLPRAGPVRISVHDAMGRELTVLENAPLESGPHEVTWRGRDAADRPLPTGLYFVRARLPGGAVVSRKVMLLR